MVWCGLTMRVPVFTMVALRTKVWPWFVLAALLLFVGAVLLHGTPQAVCNSAAAIVFLAACIRKVALATRDNDVAAQMVVGPASGYSGWLMARDAGRRRSAAAREANAESVTVRVRDDGPAPGGPSASAET